MTAFATALASLHADRNLAVPALYRVAGKGPPMEVRVIRSTPDAVNDGFQPVRTRRDHLSVRRIDCPLLTAGDTFEIQDPASAPELVVVADREQDHEGLSWSVSLRRA